MKGLPTYFVMLLLLCKFVAAQAPQGGVALQRLSLPTGPGSIEGLGESFEPDLSTGSARYSVKFDIPPVAGGFSPELTLAYDSNLGIGPFGIGWTLSLPSIQRQTENGIPNYNERDTFISLGEELVELTDGSFLSENCKDYSRFRRINDGWEKALPNGIKLYFGENSTSREVTPGSDTFAETFQWLLSSSVDLHGNRIEYLYTNLPGSSGIKYLSQIRFGFQGNNPTNYHTISFRYDLSDAPPISYASGLRRKTGHRCNEVAVKTVVNDSEYVVRSYEIRYSDRVRVPLIETVTQFDANGNRLPPMEFGYLSSHLEPSSREEPTYTSIRLGIPAQLWQEDIVVCDLNQDGLNDICYSVPDRSWRYLLNRGNLGFTDAKEFAGIPTSLSLRDSKTQLVDINGDGRVDLVTTVPNDEGDQRVAFYEINRGIDDKSGLYLAAIDPKSKQSFANTCSIDPTMDGVRLFDVDFNKCVDLVQILDDSLIVATNKLNSEGLRAWDQKNVFYSESEFPSDTISPTMRLADVNGDRIMDFVDLFEQDGFVRITCYYGAGDGRFSSGQLLTFADGDQLLESGECPTSNLSSFHFADVNSDGLSDLVQVIPGNVRVWISQGEFFEEPQDWAGPSFRTATQVLLVDMNGNGSSDVVWLEPGAEDGNQLKVLDCFPSGRGNLLSTISNGIGERIDISYRTITDYYMAAIEMDNPWNSVSPIPLHVVSRVSRSNSLDLDQDGEKDSEVSNFVYRNPYYDGREKQFRGFESVTRIDWGDDLDIKAAGTATRVTRHRYHTGAPDGIDNDGNGQIDEFNHVSGSEEESLKGRLLWEEICGIEAFDLNEGLTYIFPKKSYSVAGLDIDDDGDSEFETVEQYTDDRLVYRRTINLWKLRTLHDASTAPTLNDCKTKERLRVVRDTQLESEIVQFIEGPNVTTLEDTDQIAFAPRVVKTSFSYNDFGGVTRKTEYGVVSPDASADAKRIQITEFAHQGSAIDNWILDRVARTTVYDSFGKIVSGERFFYGNLSDSFDALPLFQISPRAMRVKTEALLVPDSQAGFESDQLEINDRWIPRSWEGFDRFGNASWILDGEADPATPTDGHSRQLTYDPAFNAFPVVEAIHIAPGKQLQAQAAFDLAFGRMTELVDFNEDDVVTIRDIVAGEAVGANRTVKGKRTTLRYDSHSRLSALIRPGDSAMFPTERYIYVPADPEGQLQYLYDENGDLRLRTIVDDNWQIEFGAGNEKVSLAAGLSGVVTLKREKAGQEGTVGTVSFTDGMGRSIAVASENESEQTLFLESVLLDSRGNAAQVLQPHENATWTPRSSTRRQHIKRDPLGRVTSTVHPKDQDEFSASTTTLYLPLTERKYDEEDNRVGGNHEGTFTDLVSDGFGRLTKVRQHVRLSDTGDSVPQLNVWETQYGYDTNDQLVRITDAQNNIAYHYYDSLGRRRSINDPDRGKSTFDYDLADNEILRTDARGATICTEYDGANRKLTQTGEFDGNTQTVSFHYDTPKPGITDGSGNSPNNCLGRLAWVEDLAGEEHHSYTPRGLTHWTLRRYSPGDDNQRDYYKYEEFDSQDRRVEQKLKSHGNHLTTFDTSFNRRGLIKSHAVGDTIVSSYRYHPNGVVAQTDFGNTTTTNAALDHRLRLRSLRISKRDGGAKKSLIDNQYTYDNASNLLRIDDLRSKDTIPFDDPRRNTQVFTLDDTYRLRSADYFTKAAGNPATTSIGFGFDRIGNQLEKTATGDWPDDPFWRRGIGKSSYTSRGDRDGATVGQPGPHAINSTDGGSKLSFDEAGSAKQYDGNTLIRDAWGRISRVVNAANGNEAASYQYSHDGDRLIKITSDRVFYPFAEVRDSLNSGLRHYLMNGEERLAAFESDKHFILHRDQIGSLILTTSENADVVEEITYMPYGAIRYYKVDEALGFTSHYRFSGNEYDAESGLHFFRNRNLIAGLGSFASCDPVILSHKHKFLTNPTSLNPYLYSLGNPGRYTDPKGDLAFVPVILGYIALDMILDTTPANAPGIEDEPIPGPSVREQLASAAGTVLGAKAIGHALKGVSGFVRSGSQVVRQSSTVSKGLTTPNKYFGSKTKAQAEAALEAKFGPPKSIRPHAKTYYNPNTKRSFNVHQEPGHQGGRPHVDIRTRGNIQERKFELKDN